MSMSAKQAAHDQVITQLLIVLQKRGVLNKDDVSAISAGAKEIYDPTNRNAEVIHEAIDNIINQVKAEQ